MSNCLILLIKADLEIKMITEDKIAAAQIAQLFGSELLRVQEGARTDSGNVPNIVNLDPKSFLASPGQQYSPSTQAREQLLYKHLQAEAESQHPLPPESQSQQSSPSLNTIHQPTLGVQTTTEVPRAIQQSFTQSASSNPLEKIANCLERIAIRLDQLELVAKKKKVRRISK